MRPLRLQCFSCVLTLRKVMVPAKAQRHIVRKHYPERKNGRWSMFCERTMPSHRLFNVVIDLLRSGRLKASEKQDRNGRHNYIYYYTFPFNVGVFPKGHGRFRKTKTIKIVTRHSKCQECSRHWPSKVITSYPCKKKKKNNLICRNGYKRRET